MMKSQLGLFRARHLNDQKSRLSVPLLLTLNYCLLLQDHEQQLLVDLISVSSNFFHHRLNMQRRVLFQDKEHFSSLDLHEPNEDKHLSEDLNQGGSMIFQD